VITRLAAVVLVFLALATGVGGLALALHGDQLAAANSTALRELLLDGKTASAISAHKTAVEVQALLTDHAQSARQQREIAVAVSQLEKHLDATIRLAISEAAARVASEFGK
jgi:hypothetical protein